MTRRSGIMGIFANVNEAASTEVIQDLDPALIDPSPYQPRTFFDEAAIEELAVSMRVDGQHTPAIVRAVGERYELIAGERRWQAAQASPERGRAGMALRVVVREMSDRDAQRAALIENIQRENLRRVEDVQAKISLLALALGIPSGEAVRRLQAAYRHPGRHPEDISVFEAVFEGTRENWQSFTTNGVPLLELDPELQDLVNRNVIGAAVALYVNRADPAVKDALREEVLTAGPDVTLTRLQRLSARLLGQEGLNQVRDLGRTLTPARYQRLSPDLQARLDPLVGELLSLIQGGAPDTAGAEASGRKRRAKS